MPNGGFGCAYCVFRQRDWRDSQGDRCVLRDNASITNDHYTVCKNVTYPKGGPMVGPRRLSHHLPRTFPEPDGSIFAITVSEGAYLQVPWLENQEIVENIKKETSCFHCKVALAVCHQIRWDSEELDFCSFRHYLLWRNSIINSGAANDVVYPVDRFPSRSPIQKLPIIDAVSSEETRQEQNSRDSKRKRNNLFLVCGLLAGLGVWMFYL
jgi:hypothetical protein